MSSRTGTGTTFILALAVDDNGAIRAREGAGRSRRPRNAGFGHGRWVIRLESISQRPWQVTLRRKGGPWTAEDDVLSNVRHASACHRQPEHAPAICPPPSPCPTAPTPHRTLPILPKQLPDFTPASYADPVLENLVPALAALRDQYGGRNRRGAARKSAKRSSRVQGRVCVGGRNRSTLHIFVALCELLLSVHHDVSPILHFIACNLSPSCNLSALISARHTAMCLLYPVVQSRMAYLSHCVGLRAVF